MQLYDEIMHKMTLDQLARMVQKGFLYMETNMAAKTDVSRLEERIESLERRVEEGFVAIAREFQDIRNQLKKLDVHDFDILNLQLRMDKVEKKLKTQP
jgi:hypothetical protein